MINSIQSMDISEQVYSTKDKKNTVEQTASAIEENSVIVDIGNNKEKNVTYGKPAAKINMADVDRLWKETENATASLRSLVERLIHRQGVKLEDLLSGKENLVVDDTAKAEAQKMISEDGEWGVKAVSTRIVDFAKAISGGDKSKISALRDAIEQGFKEAEKAFGGQLPEISKQTREEVTKQLDQWENNME